LIVREIILDTETTGLDPQEGDRIVELGCVELVNRMPTGRQYQEYLNPERDVPDLATRIHGLTTEFLKDKPVFADVVDSFLEFVGDADLVAHNAEFDMRFVNCELENLGLDRITPTRVIDTLQMARSKYPGAQNSLDALCRRLGVDNSNRSLHGALLDAQLLAEVYLELTGGRQGGLELESGQITGRDGEHEKKVRAPRSFAPSEAELQKHKAFVNSLKNPIWESGGKKS
jgi:DNA polymerase-3 subunit epsilon